MEDPYGDNSKKYLDMEFFRSKNFNIQSDPKNELTLYAKLLDSGGRNITNEEFTSNVSTSGNWTDAKYSFGSSDCFAEDSNVVPATVVIDVSSRSKGIIGTLELQLMTLEEDGEEGWFKLSHTKSKMTDTTGEIYIKYSYRLPNRNSENERQMARPSLVMMDPTFQENPEFATEDPNQLVIKVLRAKGVMIADKSILRRGKGSSDPLVKISINTPKKINKSTRSIPRTLNPEWMEMFTFDMITDPSLIITFSVFDRNRATFNVFLGKCTLKLRDFADKRPRIIKCQLKNKNNEADSESRGEIELGFHWRFNVETQKKIVRTGGLTGGKRGLLSFNPLSKLKQALTHQDESENESDGDPSNEVPDEEEQTEAEKQKQKEEKEKIEADLREKTKDIEIKDGDYSCHIHLIEARDLKAENWDGTSDPVVYIECFGQKQNSQTIHGVTSCVYDEVLIFQMKGLTTEDVENGIISISVKDANSVPAMKSKMIGSWTIDATGIYLRPDHELHRQWIALMDDEDVEDVGVQGYLKISVQLVGPGEKPKVHNEEEELAKERIEEANNGGDIGSLVMSVPNIQKTWSYVVMSVYRAESLPIMDGSVLGVTTTKTDAFVQLQVGNTKPVKTRIVTTKGNREQLNPEFNYELWMPVSVPTMTNLIKASVWDNDVSRNEIIGYINEKYNILDRMDPKTSGIKWINLYGAFENKNNSTIKDNIKKAGKFTKKFGKMIVQNELNWKTYYNSNPEHGVCYKGRLLANFRIETKLPASRAEKYKDRVEPFRRKIKPLKLNFEPKTQQLQFMALIAMGNELPDTRLLGIGDATMYVKIAFGEHEVSTNAQPNKGGVCVWNEKLQIDPSKYPIDEDMIPDFFIYLYKTGTATPICYRRIKAVDVLKKGFLEKSKWWLLKEEKDNDQIPAGIFPGQVLIKLGAGTPEQMKKAIPEWEDSFRRMTQRQAVVLRMHIYQAKNLRPTDDNGLADPYVQVKCKGMEGMTEVHPMTLFPQYYKTIEFKGLSIPTDKEFIPQVALKLYDKDTIGSDDIMGVALFDLTSDACSFTDDPDDPPPKAQWIEFFDEEPGDGEGRIQVSAQVILGDASIAARLGPPPSIVPEMRKAYMEVIAVGLRGLKPYMFVPMQQPFLEIDVPSGSQGRTRETYTTKPSRRPDPDNPNYLERLVIPIMLPVDAQFSPTLQIRVRDTRLGGWDKPQVGVGCIDLETKVPWSATYRPPQTDQFFGGGESSLDSLVQREKDFDPRVYALEQLELKREASTRDDPLIGTNEPLDVDKFLFERSDTAVEDTGAGVFGAMRHIDLQAIGGTSNKRRQIDDMFSRDGFSLELLEQDAPPKYMVNRQKLTGTLEEELKTTPFENYILTRGQKTLFSNVKTVGLFKGLIRICEVEPVGKEDSILPAEMLDQLERPKAYIVRLYCLRGVGLTPMDMGFMGRPGKSDPYLRIQLGKFKFNDRKNAVDDVVDCDFYKYIEIETTLPGASQLKIEVMDKDLIGGDDLIGATIIDLEDRWFDSRWQELGNNLRITPSDPMEDPRWDVKPLEMRPIYVPSNGSSQGQLECWVDILRPEESKIFPPDEVALPPVQVFEVRVVIWNARHVVAGDGLENMSDLYVKVWPEGCDPQFTDTHWRAKKGKASWNWRLLFDVELGHNTRSMKFPYLHIQLWDKDLLKYDDCMGEYTKDMTMYYRKCYKKNVALKLFEKAKGASASKLKRAQKKQKKKELVEIPDAEDDVPPNEETLDMDEREELMNKMAVESSEVKGKRKGGKSGEIEMSNLGPDGKPKFSISRNRFGRIDNKKSSETTNPLTIGGDDTDSDDDNDKDSDADDSDADVDNDRDGYANLNDANHDIESGKHSPVDEEAKADVVAPKKKSNGWFGGWFGSSAKKKDSPEDEEESEDEETQLLLEKDKKEAEADDMRETVNSIKNMTGLWDIDPDDSEWAKFYSHDHNTGEMVFQGELAYSVQIWPKDKATVMRAGSARTEPNTDPFLPPPVGRMKFYLNPFLMGSELCGPVLCAKFFCCFLCIVFCVLMIFAQPFLTLIINLFFFF